MKKLFTILFSLSVITIAAQSDVYKYGDGVLKGKIEPVDNPIAFEALDSLLSDNPKTRAFFFGVLKVMVNKGNEALKNGYVGSSIRYYASLYGKDYIANYKTLTPEEAKTFNYLVARSFCEQYPYETYEDYTKTNDNYTLTINNWMTEITDNCRECRAETETLDKVKAAVLADALVIHKTLWGE